MKEIDAIYRDVNRLMSGVHPVCSIEAVNRQRENIRILRALKAEAVPEERQEYADIISYMERGAEIFFRRSMQPVDE